MVMIHRLHNDNFKMFFISATISHTENCNILHDVHCTLSLHGFTYLSVHKTVLTFVGEKKDTLGNGGTKMA